MLTLQQLTEIAPIIDARVPPQGWVDLNEIHTAAIVDHGFTCTIAKFIELMKLCGLHVRADFETSERRRYKVARRASGLRTKAEERTPLYKYRRTLIAFLEDMVGEGERYIARDVYEQFRRCYKCPQLSANTLGRALRGSPFTTVTKRIDGVCTRVILRQVDLAAEAAQRDQGRAIASEVRAS